MAESTYLASALATGVLLLGVWALVSRLENWRSYDAAPGRRDRETESGDAATSWIVGFVAVTLAVGGLAVLVVSDASLAAALGGGWVALVAAFGVLLGGFLLWGAYNSVRHRGYHSAQAALMSAWVFGSLVVAAIAVKLVLASA